MDVFGFFFSFGTIIAFLMAALNIRKFCDNEFYKIIVVFMGL